MKKTKYIILALLILLTTTAITAHGEENDHRTAHHTEASVWQTDVLPVAVAGAVIATLVWIYRLRPTTPEGGEQRDRRKSPGE